MQDPIIKTLVEQNKKLMDMIAEKENVNPNKKRTNYAPRKWNYCWTHGACDHSSKDCKFKEEGHEDNATHEDRKAGNNNRCEFATVKRQLQNS